MRILETAYILILFLIGTSGFGQNPDAGPRTVSELPEVFLIGEYENLYSKLYEQYPGILLTESGNNMEEAFEKWLYMIYSMEDYSREIDYDLKGLKLWLHVFFNQNGSIDHILFFNKPQSKNVDDKELVAFFKTFMKNFKLPIEANQNFNHSGSASFPTYGHPAPQARQDKE